MHPIISGRYACSRELSVDDLCGEVQMGIRVKYTLKFLVGLAFVTGIVYLGYWLVAEYEVRNTLALIAIGIFIVIPAIKVVFSLPGELRVLYLVWSSDDPETIERLAGDLRERDRL